MKLVKFGIFAMALGLFTASCGGDTNEEAMENDTTVVAPVETAPATTPTMEAAPADSTTMMGADSTTMGTNTTTTTTTTPAQ